MITLSTFLQKSFLMHTLKNKTKMLLRLYLLRNKDLSLFSVPYQNCELKRIFFCKMSWESCAFDVGITLLVSEKGYCKQFQKECCNFGIEIFILECFLYTVIYIISMFWIYKCIQTYSIYITLFSLHLSCLLRAENLPEFYLFWIDMCQNVKN